MEIVFATANPHKLQEVKAICDCDVVDFVLPDSGFNPIENGSTFEENSLIKAKVKQPTQPTQPPGQTNQQPTQLIQTQSEESPGKIERTAERVIFTEISV